MIIEVFNRREYGNVRTYPNNREAELFLKLIVRGTFAPDHLETIKELGYEVSVVADPLILGINPT